MAPFAQRRLGHPPLDPAQVAWRATPAAIVIGDQPCGQIDQRVRTGAGFELGEFCGGVAQDGRVMPAHQMQAIIEPADGLDQFGVAADRCQRFEKPRGARGDVVIPDIARRCNGSPGAQHGGAEQQGKVEREQIAKLLFAQPCNTEAVNGPIQVWIAGNGRGGEANPATTLPDDIEDFVWDADGRGLVVATRPAIRLQTEAIAREARQGFLFDDRFIPQSAGRPIPTGPFPRVAVHVDLATGSVRDATATEATLLNPTAAPSRPKDAKIYAAAPKGMAAWTAAKDPSLLIAPTKLVMRNRDGRLQECADRDCEDIGQLWWSKDGRTLYAHRRAGWTARYWPRAASRY